MKTTFTYSHPRGEVTEYRWPTCGMLTRPLTGRATFIVSDDQTSDDDYQDMCLTAEQLGVTLDTDNEYDIGDGWSTYEGVIASMS